MSLIQDPAQKPYYPVPIKRKKSERLKFGLKRMMDLVLVLGALPLLPLIFLPIMAAIKLESRGPVFFRQKRYGLNGQVINVLKFRTMKQEKTCADGRIQAQRNDDRVTKVGRILRKTCLDELPQVIDVLAGRMSVVGPRPHPTGMYIEGKLAETVIPGYMQRLRMRPGITGLAQVNGNRGPIETVERGIDRIRLDNQYIETWTLWMDLKILLRTAKILSDDGCY